MRRRPVSFPVAAGVGFVSSEFPFNIIGLACTLIKPCHEPIYVCMYYVYTNIIIKCVRVDHSRDYKMRIAVPEAAEDDQRVAEDDPVAGSSTDTKPKDTRKPLLGMKPRLNKSLYVDYLQKIIYVGLRHRPYIGAHI